jgi:hypothetical protein
MADYTNWYDVVLPDFPGSNPASVLIAIRDAAIEFCARTSIWRIFHPPITSVVDQKTYPFAPGVTGAVVAKVIQARFNGQELTPATPDQLNAIYPSGWNSLTGTPLYYTQHDERNVRLVPTTAEAITDALDMYVSLKPTLTSTSVPDVLYEEHRERIAHGARTRMYRSPKKPYTDLEMAKAEYAMFEMAIGASLWTATAGHGRAKRRVAGSFF